jgi:hypothetical protein
MFTKKSFVDEIAGSMERHLIDGAINKQAERQEKLVKAADYLNAAAEIFDESGLTAQAEVVTAILESLAAKKSKKDKKKLKSKTKKPVAKKPLNSGKMVENLKEKGWVFDESDSADQHCVDDNCAMCGDMSYADDSEEELYSMLEDFKSRSESSDFEDELDLTNPDTLSDEDFHPDFKMKEFGFEDPEYSADHGEPYDPIYNKYVHSPGPRIRHNPKYKDDALHYPALRED